MNDTQDNSEPLRSSGWFGLRYFRDVLNGNPTWLERMNGLGPALTASPKNAARFETEADAGNARFARGAVHGVCFEVARLPNTQGLVTPGTGRSVENAPASRRHQ